MKFTEDILPIIFLLLFVFAVVFEISCGAKNIDNPNALKARIEAQLPEEATNIRGLGNGWYLFDLGNKQFLYSPGFVETTSEGRCITQID